MITNVVFALLFFTGPAVTGCAAAALPAVDSGAQDAQDTSQVAPSSVPLLPPAVTYGTQQAEPLNPLESDLWQQIQRVIGNRCELDGALIRAARKHASDVLAHATASNESIGIDYLRFALLYFGSPDYLVSPLVFNANEASDEALRQLMAARPAGGWTHCGIGVHHVNGHHQAVFVAVTRGLSLSAIPVQVVPGQMLNIQGQLLASDATGVATYVEAPDGHVIRLKTVGVGTGPFKVSVPIRVAGKYKLEFQVTTRSGPETAVLVPLYAGVDVPRRPSVLPDPQEPEMNSTQQMMRLINRIRENHGLRPLIRDIRLDSVAQRHSEDMANTATFGHYSTRSGMLADRLQAKGLYPRMTAENIAQSNSMVRVHHNLMQSPSHKIKVLMPEFTHLGLGIVSRGGTTTVTQIFAAW